MPVLIKFRIPTRLLSALLLNVIFSHSFAFASENNENIYTAAINHPQRPSQDRIRDKTRKPELILPFSQIKSGDKVLELGAGGGHTTELIARVVGDKGRIYSQGLSPTRIQSNRLPSVTALRRHILYELPDVLNENNVKPGTLDAAVIFFALHDFYLNPRMDQQAVLKNIHQWLKPGGSLIILDNAANADAGTSVNRRLHRIGENFVISELNKAGFEVESKSDALRNPEDNHTRPWRMFNGLHDRFAIRFVKKPN